MEKKVLKTKPKLTKKPTTKATPIKPDPDGGVKPGFITDKILDGNKDKNS